MLSRQIERATHGNSAFCVKPPWSLDHYKVNYTLHCTMILGDLIMHAHTAFFDKEHISRTFKNGRLTRILDTDRSYNDFNHIVEFQQSNGIWADPSFSPLIRIEQSIAAAQEQWGVSY